MSDLVDFKLVGFDQLRNALESLPQALASRVLRGAVATGASVIRKEAVARAPLYTGADGEVMSLIGRRAAKMSAGHPPPGTLKRSIYQFRLSAKSGPMRETFIVSVRTGKRVGKNGKASQLDAYYASWVEFGHYTRPKGGGRVGRGAKRAALIASGGVRWVKPHPFMRPAFESKKAEAIKAMQDYISQNLPIALQAARDGRVLKVTR